MPLGFYFVKRLRMLWGFCGRVEGVWVIDFIDG